MRRAVEVRGQSGVVPEFLIRQRCVYFVSEVFGLKIA